MFEMSTFDIRMKLVRACPNMASGRGYQATQDRRPPDLQGRGSGLIARYGLISHECFDSLPADSVLLLEVVALDKDTLSH